MPPKTRLFSGWFEHIGWRPTLEDKVLAEDSVNKLTAAPNAPSSQQHDPESLLEPHAVYAVFDGHGGSECSEFVAGRMIGALLSNRDFYTQGDLSRPLLEIFRNVDQEFLATGADGDPPFSGSTCIMAIVRGSRLITANVGDSRAILCRARRGVPLSEDQKPNRPDEQRRIERAGGFVEMDRVNGWLAVSRAFGDFDYKFATSVDGRYRAQDHHQQLVICDPEVKEFSIDRECDFLVLACDGIWDVLSNQDVCNLCYDVRTQLSKKGRWSPSVQSAKQIAETVVREALNRASTDNCSAVVVIFDHQQASHSHPHVHSHSLSQPQFHDPAQS